MEITKTIPINEGARFTAIWEQEGLVYSMLCIIKKGIIINVFDNSQRYLNKLKNSKFIIHDEGQEPFKLEDCLFKNAPVMVRKNNSYSWELQYWSYGQTCYLDGRTKNTCKTGQVRTWNEIRLPTITEAPRNMMLAHHKNLSEPEGINDIEAIFFCENGSIYAKRSWDWTNNNSPIKSYIILED